MYQTCSKLMSAAVQYVYKRRTVALSVSLISAA
nr:MAG TPA: hypothetical protein [Caudoviricetes sp.]